MAKGQVIPARVKRLIAEVYTEHPKMPAKNIRKEVNTLYRKDYPHIGENWPGLSVVQKILHDIRSEHIPNPKDVPWSLYTLAEFDIPADALQVVLDAYAIKLSWGSETLTVREAMWVARLHQVLTNIEELTMAAKECADNEIINEITHEPLPSLVDADFQIRAITGKPGISYKYLGDGNFQMVIHDSRITENIDILPLPKCMLIGSNEETGKKA